MRKATWLFLTTFCLGLLACGGKDESSSPTDGIPDAAALTLEVTGGAQEQGAAALLPGAAAALTSESTWPVTGDDLAEAQKKIAAVNAAIRQVFDHVAAVAATSGVAWGSGRVYGPAERCAVDVTPCPLDASASFRLWIGKAAGRGGAFVLQAKPLGAADADYRTVLAGWMRRGKLARRGAGQIWIDLNHVKAVVPGYAYPGQGTLFGGFAAEGEAGHLAKAEVLVLREFTPDATDQDWPAATVAFRGFRTAAGAARVRVAAIKDLYAGTPTDTELGLAHVVYKPDLGGRAYALVGNYSVDGTPHGNVPADHYFFGRSCYAPRTPSAPVFNQWFLCPAAEAPKDCALDGANPSVVQQGTSWATDCAIDGEPTLAGPPPTAPGTDPAAEPGALPGEDGTSLTPEDAPVDEGGAPTPG